MKYRDKNKDRISRRSSCTRAEPGRRSCETVRRRSQSENFAVAGDANHTSRFV